MVYPSKQSTRDFQILEKSRTLSVAQNLQKFNLWINYLECKLEDIVLSEGTLCSEDVKLTKKQIFHQFGKCGCGITHRCSTIIRNYDSPFEILTFSKISIWWQSLPKLKLGSNERKFYADFEFQRSVFGKLCRKWQFKKQVDKVVISI